MRHVLVRRTLLAVATLAGGALAGTPAAARAQWSTTYEQFYLPGKFNWQFRHNYPGAERLFNAFDYGHAILYEKLWTDPAGARPELEEKQYDFITRELLAHPPHVALEESAIEVAYAKLAPEAKAMFDWAHLLHRQIYDVWSDESLSDAQRDAKVQELIRYYKSRPDLAFSSQPKTMELMEGQPYSTAFRKNFPKFNGLIWAYHWLQVGLYEPLVIGRTAEAKHAGVDAAVTRFRQMLLDPPRSMPYIMPMTAAVAPTFATRYPEAAIIFDNLHSMHDVVSDILANPSVPRDRKRAEILTAGRRYRDATSYVQTAAEWREMAQMMGIENMGGPAVGFLPTLPTPTVERGAVMAGMEHGQMPGMKMGAAHGAPAPAMDHSRMNMPGRAAAGAAPDSATMRGMQHGGAQHGDVQPGAARDTMSHGAMSHGAMSHGAMSHGAMSHGADSAAMHAPGPMMDLHMRMMADPVIRQRVMADPAMRQAMQEMMDRMPAEHRDEMSRRMKRDEAAPAARPRVGPAGRRPRGVRPASPRRKPGATGTRTPGHAAGMDHGAMPGMKKP